jgi:hypothetical protein
MALPQDWKEFIALLNSHRVDYVVVGAIAVSYHAYPRNTGDLDILIRPTLENGQRLAQAMEAFGFASLGLKPEDFIQAGQFIQLGVRPRRIDLLNQVSGVDFEEVWEDRVITELDGTPVMLMGREALIKNKKACGRDKDRVDLRMLGVSTD